MRSSGSKNGSVRTHAPASGGGVTYDDRPEGLVNTRTCNYKCRGAECSIETYKSAAAAKLQDS